MLAEPRRVAHYCCMDRIVDDGRIALRGLRKPPPFAITAVLVLGLAIGMSAAMFTVFDAVLVRPLPIQAPDQVIELSGVGQGAAAKEVPLLVDRFVEYRQDARTLSSVA